MLLKLIHFMGNTSLKIAGGVAVNKIMFLVNLLLIGKGKR
jgi:hypothetical protein